MDVLGAHSYDTLVELEREEYHEKKLKRWWGNFSCSEQEFLRYFLGDATTLLHTTLHWHLVEVITSYWDPALRCVTIGNVDLVPTLEEYDRFLSLSTPLSQEAYKSDRLQGACCRGVDLAWQRSRREHVLRAPT